MPEQLDLSTPIVSYQVAAVRLDWENSLIQIRLKSNTNPPTYADQQLTGTVAAAALSAINVENFSQRSLHALILGYGIANGFVAGSISGSPDEPPPQNGGS